MKAILKVMLVLVAIVAAGLSVGIGISIAPNIQAMLDGGLMSSMDASATTSEEKSSDEPLYWVAPMDPNYRRDAPGQSPMGMDLVPVYDDGEDLPAGTVKISPEVINNLGVRTAVVKKEKIEDEITTVGTVAFDERQLYEVHSRVSGWIKTLAVRADGDEIKQYQRLYDIYSPELVSAQEELLVALSTGEANFRAASIEKLRNLGVSRGSINQLLKTKKVINNISIYAPNKGVVSELRVGQGAYVTPNTRIMSVSGMDPVWVEGEVFENNLSKLRIGAKVDISAEANPGRLWVGEVDYIYPKLESSSRTVKIRIIIDNPDRALLPNMFVRLRIDTATENSTLSVPHDAVIRTGSMDRVVLATGSGRFKSVKVKTGLRSRKQVEILEGLEEGDEIVVSAQFLIDSESSISSDFMRMTPPVEMPEIAWATGTVEDLYADENVVLINHLPVPEWKWPSMQMEFSYAPEVSAESLVAGSSVKFSMRKLESGEVLIESIKHEMEAGQ